MKDPFPPVTKYCHRTGFTQKCLKLVSSKKCDRWWQLEGSDPITGEAVNEYGCVDDWHVPLLLDLAKKVMNGTAGTQAAVESFRNEMVLMNSDHDVPRLTKHNGV